MSYQHLLVAVDLSEDSKLLVEKAVALAKPLNAEVSFIHIDVNYAELYTALSTLIWPKRNITRWKLHKSNCRIWRSMPITPSSILWSVAAI